MGANDGVINLSPSEFIQIGFPHFLVCFKGCSPMLFHLGEYPVVSLCHLASIKCFLQTQLVSGID